MKKLLIGIILVTSAVASTHAAIEVDRAGAGDGQTASRVDQRIAPQECPDRKKLKNICMTISGRMLDKDKKHKYLYQTKILEAACVGANDSQAVTSEKVSKAWAMFESDMLCTTPAFDVPQGSILKYAFHQEFDDFLNDAIRWKVDLNSVDSSDGRTLLDYVQDYVMKNKGNDLEQRYANYYLKLREAGAKHRSEL